jgi:hypothetical protein
LTKKGRSTSSGPQNISNDTDAAHSVAHSHVCDRTNRTPSLIS